MIAFFFPLQSAEKPGDVPNPLTTAGLYVGDGAGLLGPEYIALIDGLCRALKTATTAEMAVITVRNMGGTTIEDFADQIFRRFGIGVKGKDNGILILCAFEERDVRIEVGYGLEAVITDAAASRLLDEQAVPFLGKNEWGRGLYALAKAAAAEIAKSQGASVNIADPAVWPAPTIVPEMKTAASEKTPPAGRRSGTGPIIFALLAAAWGLLGMSGVNRRFHRQRARAARAKAISGANGIVGLLWTGATGGIIALAASGSALFPSILALLSPIGVTVGQGLFRKTLRRSLEGYKLPCAKCGTPMELTPEDQDDAQLSVEEAAEEMAGGMDYEIWTCASCGNQERLSVKLNKAKDCPQCKRRTLKETTTTLVAATTAHGGRVRHDLNCLNPKCGYAKTYESSTPRLSPSSSSGSHGSSGSSRSSFGGGRSGGGGASRHF
jgi:uncharacterized protein